MKPISIRQRLAAAIKMLAAVPALNFDVVSCVNRRSLAELDAMKELLIAAGVKRWRLFTIFPAGRAAAYSTSRPGRSTPSYGSSCA